MCEILHATSFSRDANEKVFWPGGLSRRIVHQHQVIKTDMNHTTIRRSRVHGERSMRINFSLCLLFLTLCMYTYIESFPVPKRLFDNQRCCCSYTLASIIITFSFYYYYFIVFTCFYFWTIQLGFFCFCFSRQTGTSKLICIRHLTGGGDD